jgi:hypothetical protein
VLVDVKVTSTEDREQKNGHIETGVYDVRLYRNRQLVGQWPDPAAFPSSASATVDLSAWRDQHRMLKGSGVEVHTFEVRVPTAESDKPVTLMAYGYNDDRVKTVTSPMVTYTVPKDVVPQPPRAYVIAIGVNAYQNARRDLRFAADDAASLVSNLKHLSRQGREYEVVPLSLISDAVRGTEGERTIRLDQATKANIRSVMLALSDPSQVQSLVRAGVASAAQLRPATPDDFVVISFSGHGMTRPDGSFYIVPSDSGVNDDLNDTQKLISSQEVAEWLRPVDAGQLVLVLDACHAGASVDAPGFKPGPMGDASFGQLAYDKTMRILAASQADDVALESRSLRHGLLTYALIDEGLGSQTGKALADLDGNGQVDLGEWLRYGERRVPQLFADIRNGKRRSVRGLEVEPTAFGGFPVQQRDAVPVHTRTTLQQRAQLPALFEFGQSNPEVVISRPRESVAPR